MTQIHSLPRMSRRNDAVWNESPSSKKKMSMVISKILCLDHRESFTANKHENWDKAKSMMAIITWLELFWIWSAARSMILAGNHPKLIEAEGDKKRVRILDSHSYIRITVRSKAIQPSPLSIRPDLPLVKWVIYVHPLNRIFTPVGKRLRWT